MSKSIFHCHIAQWQEIHQLPDSWPQVKLREIVELAEYDDEVSDADLHDIVLMLLQDKEPRLAAELVLECVFGDTMRSGVRQNIAEDLQEDRPWEDFAVVEQQAGLFESVVLLQRAFPKYFGIPDAIEICVDVTSSNAETRDWLRAPLSKPLLARLLAAGMDEHAVLNRLYEDELRGDSFATAEAILWRMTAGEPEPSGENLTRQFRIISSQQWIGPLENRESWDAKAWPDGH